MQTEPWIEEVPLPPTLRAGPVRAWLGHVPRSGAATGPLLECLPAEDQQRAARFLAPDARARFIASRVLLQEKLGQILGSKSAKLEFQRTPRGKPFLARTAALPDIRFNLTHSGDLILLATTEGVEVGVDIEQIRDRPDLDALASRFFARAEADLLTSFGSPGQRELFYRIWTRKEAVLKASGVGITSGLREPDVSSGLEDAALASGLRVELAGRAYELFELSLAPGYAAALAIETTLEAAKFRKDNT